MMSLSHTSRALQAGRAGPPGPAPCSVRPRSSSRTTARVLAPELAGDLGDRRLDHVRESLAARLVDPPAPQQQYQQPQQQQQQQQQQQPQAAPYSSNNVLPSSVAAAVVERRSSAAGAGPSQAVADEEWHPSMGWRMMPHHLSNDALWQRIRQEAKAAADSEPSLASFLYSSILTHSSFERALAFILANKLASPTLFSTQLMKIATDAYEEDPGIMESCIADLQAVFDRDPACDQYTQCLLYFKGFQAVQCQRIAHHLWGRGRKSLAIALQSRIAEAFQVDVHPAATIGRGVMLDHATGVVIGETTVIGDNVSMLHHVTLGGSGTGKGVRHPTIGHGVLLGAGVSVLGNVTVGCGTKVGAGSVVVSDLPCHAVAVGVPARIIKKNSSKEPVADMDQCEDFILDYVI